MKKHLNLFKYKTQMGKFLDIFLIAALAFNLFTTYNNYTPDTEVLGVSMPTWVTVIIQVFLIFVLGYKVWRNYAAEKQI